MMESKQSTKRDILNSKIRNFKSMAYLWAHGLFYGVLFKLGLGWKFSEWLCKNGWYKKFSDGRCMYCGKIKVVK